MKKSTSLKLSRRDLLTKVMPACALTCIVPCHALGKSMPDFEEFLQDEKHKFDTEMDRKMTFRQLFMRQYFNIIELGQGLKKELGDEKAIALIKEISDKAAISRGKMQAKQAEKNDLLTFAKPFKDTEGFKNLLTMEIVKDTEEAFEIKVTECLWAEAFKAQKAADIGFAWVCYGDYGLPEGFNPKLKMVRDKTLMQGHDCCNHRYVYKT